MQKIIFLGTDLHGPSSELASKIVRDLSERIKNSGVLSLENRKPFSSRENKIVIPKIFGKNYFRGIIQGILLPICLIFLRLKYNTIFTFWTAGKKYHYFLFRLIKFLKYRTFFTVISGYDKDYSALKFCDKIICQSEKMKRHLSEKLPDKEITVILPWTNLDVFKPKRKEYDLLIPSVPYDIKDFKERGIDKLIDILEKNKIKAKIIFRSDETYNYFKKLGLKNAELINGALSDRKLAEIMSKAGVIPLIYSSNAPDMPLSAIEGMACGCAIICTEHMGLADIIKKKKCGIVLESEKGLSNAINKISNNSSYNKNARKAAEKYFSIKNLNKYLELTRK